MWTLALIGALWLAGPAATSASGRVVSEDGAAVKGAEVCAVAPQKLEDCVKTDDQGGYTIPATMRPKLIVRASGFVSMVVDAAPLNEPVKLKRAAALRVTIVDAADGKPVAKGRVMLDAPSGKRIGDYVPFNQAGVRISTVEPGIVFVRADAEGYEPGGPVPIELTGGAESSVTVTMTKTAAKRH
jgi:hypothetical protein